MTRDTAHMLDRMRACPTRQLAIDILDEAEDFLRSLPEADRDRAYHAAEEILEIVPED